jgi:hypothetical protein
MWLLSLLACHQHSDLDPCVYAHAWVDHDEDGFGDPETGKDVCPGTAGYVSNGDDCDDADTSVHPGAAEICNGLDDDCDGESDPTSAWYADADGDGYGTGAKQLACAAPDGTTAEGNDCDDADASIHPGATELCNAFDDDCDGTDDDGFDIDGDGHLSSVECATGDDCDDDDPTVYPGAPELCGDDRDNDCVAGDSCGLSGDYDLADADAKVYATNEYEFMGTSMETGDVDGDGTLDVFLSAWNYPDYGAGHVLYGPISGTHPVEELGFVAYGSFGSRAGTSIGIGDVNDDGYADIELGASDTEEAWVQFGPVTADVDLANDASVHYAGRGLPHFGFGSDIGDVDGDGIEDLLAGSYDFGGEASKGTVFIDFGPLTGGEIDVTDAYDVELYSTELGAELGTEIHAGEDMDGDGVGDVMLQRAGDSPGVFVAHGPFPNDLDVADADAFLSSTHSGAGLGWGMAQADVDGDGSADALLSAPFATAGAGPRESPRGRAYVVSGATTGTFDLEDADVKIRGTDAAYFGYALAAGDIDADGDAELFATGNLEDDGATAAYVFYGVWPGTWDDVDASARFVEASGAQILMTLAAADLDANGCDDVLFDAFEWTPEHPGGALYIEMSNF